MTYRKFLFFLVFVFGISTPVYVQNPPINFHHLTVENGLNDGHIQMIGQDKFGLIWFGSLGALNRYDGRVIRTYAYRAGDTTAPLSGLAFCMATDSSGKQFFGFDNGLAEFDFKNNTFKKIEIVKEVAVYRMVVVAKDRIFLITDKGLVKYDPLSKKALFYFDTDTLLKGAFGEAVLHNNLLYISTEKGIVLFDLATEKASRLSILDKMNITSLCFDDKNRLWVTAYSEPKVFRISADLTTFENYDKQLTGFDPILAREYFIIKDKKNRIWISTKHIGLLQYLPESNSFARYIQDEQKPWTPSSNVHLSIFCDKDGMIWLGGSEGVNYFHPDKNLFETILPFATELEKRSRRWARSVVEDKDKNLWFGTVDGLVKYDTKTKTYREWRNQPNKPTVIVYNSIREIFCDDNNDIWLATSKGLNRYNHKTDKIEFFSPQRGFPQVSYRSFLKDRNNNQWFVTLDGEGFYQYDSTLNILRGISQHPELQRFAGLSGWCLFQDSKGRYWLGFNEQGLGMYDPLTHKTYHWKSEGVNAIAGNLVMDIKEDHNGVIWIATNHGVTQIDFEKNSFKTYNTDNGLGSNTTSAIAVDAINRVWIGTTKGLMMLDNNRQNFTNFGIQDGLPSLTFTEFPAYTTSEGEIIMPTQKGYIRFNPLNYANEKQKLNFYAASFSAFNVERPLVEDDGQAKISIDLLAKDNFFSFNLVALNFLNPAQTWYAYRLEGLEKEWHITQDPKAVYTNVQGGTYIFRYKASLNARDWDVVEKTISVHVGTIFYKTWWFWGLLITLFTSLIWGYFNNTKQQKERVENLQSKAQLLEKEKAVMQYEGLKQQLNPHFLFNSLTSLSSLIQIDTQVANEFLESLSKTYRYILKSSETETVPLSAEIKFAQSFVMLQKTRFEAGLIVNFNIAEEDLDKKVVPVTLQNLIENAIKHNIIDPESPLQIDIFTQNMAHPDRSRAKGSPPEPTPDNQNPKYPTLVVRNNLQKKNYVETSNKRGLDNLINLYHYISDKPVEIIETMDSFTVKIPLI